MNPVENEILKYLNYKNKIVFDVGCFRGSFTKKLIKYAPKDFLLDLFFLLLISKKDYKIYEFPVNVKNRFKEQAKGGGSISGKIKLTINTLKYILFLDQNKSNLIWK